jgi:hypothetical protein
MKPINTLFGQNAKFLSRQAVHILSTGHELMPAGVNVLSALRGEYKACRGTEDFPLVSDKET